MPYKLRFGGAFFVCGAAARNPVSAVGRSPARGYGAVYPVLRVLGGPAGALCGFRRTGGEVRSPDGQRDRQQQLIVLAVARWLLSGLRGLLLLMPKRTFATTPLNDRF